MISPPLFSEMKHILLKTIAAVVLVGCGGPSAPDVSILETAV